MSDNGCLELYMGQKERTREEWKNFSSSNSTENHNNIRELKRTYIHTHSFNFSVNFFFFSISRSNSMKHQHYYYCYYFICFVVLTNQRKLTAQMIVSHVALRLCVDMMQCDVNVFMSVCACCLRELLCAERSQVDFEIERRMNGKKK